MKVLKNPKNQLIDSPLSDYDLSVGGFGLVSDSFDLSLDVLALALNDWGVKSIHSCIYGICAKTSN